MQPAHSLFWAPDVSPGLLSLLENPPDGFLYSSDLAQYDVKRSPFALLAPTVEAAEAALSPFGATLAGIIVTFGNELSWRQRAPHLFHLTVPRELEPHLVPLLHSHLTLLEKWRNSEDEKRALGVELNCALDDGRRNGSEFARVKESLLEELSLRKSAEESLSYSNMVTTAELEQRRSEAEDTHKKLLQLSSAVENSPTVIAITDLAGRIEYVNPKFTEITGYLPEEVMGKNPRILKTGNLSKELYRELWRTILSGREWRGDFCNRKKNGDTYWEHASISPIRNSRGDITHFVAIKEDVTEQKRIAGELLAAQEAADAANRSKSEFLANMSHEIRTPMNAIIGITYLLEQSHPAGDAGVLIRKMGGAGRSLLALINNILDFSKIEAGRVEIEHLPFRLSSVLDNLATIMSVNVVNKNIEVIITPPGSPIDRLSGDALRLEQILINLSGNAMKFTSQGHVDVNIQVIAQSEQQVTLRFAVRDTGIGISPEKQGIIFESFSQVDASRDHRLGGTGLGLSISRRLVDLMGGDMGVISASGAGSEFWFTLSFDRDQDAALSSPEMVDLELLIAADNPVAREALRHCASALGWRACTVDSGEAALLNVSAHAADGRKKVIVLDWKMSGMDGLATARAIREVQSDTAPAPIIIMMVGAYSRGELLALPGSKLVDDVLSKPVTTSTLHDAVAKAEAARLGYGRAEKKLGPPGRRLEGLRILVVDDSDLNRDVALRIFTGEGGVVTLAEDGRQAVDWLQANSGEIDIVLMDVRMPVMDGYEATRLIHSIPELAYLPVIALTAGAFKAQEQSAGAAGMTGFISKPFNVDAAVALILKHAGRGESPAWVAPPASLMVSAHQDLPGLDLERGLAIWNDPDVYKQYLRKFARDYENSVQAIARCEPSAASSLAHKLAGAAGSLALTQVTALAKEADRVLSAGEESQGALAKLQAGLDRALVSIRVYLSADMMAEFFPTDPYDPVQAAVLLALVLEALETDDMGEVRPLLAKLHKMISPLPLAPLANAVENFDFRGGEEAIRLLAADLNISLGS